MAALSVDSQMSGRVLSRDERADDIARLKAELQLPALKYIDVSLQKELRRALQRWPLLAEFEQMQRSPGTRVSLVRQAESEVAT